ncbi:hypothetical protein CBR_g21099 [Chara braunii]|uniref:Peptidase A2 domain-containing protein n=1 Tax=Chara braunii TaxID=69332 RepID=A0A388L0N8_CHABU|nr:hypothetical protein CBR_g21099 [Chara braunii]|eukprot:GBG75855.1 hypothetical protein CBR_g21099 [Chara braunii]
MAGEASSSEGGLRKIVSSFARALNKNQGYLTDAKKKLTFDGANITKFLLDYENQAALLKWTGEEMMDHLEQHVSLSLGRDIMTIVAASRSWKETRDVMLRKYLATEKMATEADLAAVQRKNFATYNDFLREFTLVALRIPGVTDRIMSKYFLRQFFEFDKDKILSAYQQTSKFVNTRDVDFSSVTDLAEKTVVTETLALLKEGEVIDVNGRAGDKASPKLLKGLRQLLTRRRVDIDENPESPEASQEVANLQRSRGDLEDLEKAFADIHLSLPNREGGEVMRVPPGTKLSFHALPVGKLKIQIGTHHTDALVDGGAKITLIRRDFATIKGFMENKEVTGSIRGAGGEISFAGYVTKCAVKAGIRESIWSFQQMTVMEEMDHDIILERPWCANVEMIGMHLHDGTYMVDIEDPVTGRGELLRLLRTRGDPPTRKGKLATCSPSFEDGARKWAFARMEGMRERVEIMIEEAFNKKEWIERGLPQKKRRQEDKVLGVMVAERESEVDLGVSLPKQKEVRIDVSEVALEIPDLLQLIKVIRYHNVGVDSVALAKFEGEVKKGYWVKESAYVEDPRPSGREKVYISHLGLRARRKGQVWEKGAMRIWEARLRPLTRKEPRAANNVGFGKGKARGDRKCATSVRMGRKEGKARLKDEAATTVVKGGIRTLEKDMGRGQRFPIPTIQRTSLAEEEEVQEVIKINNRDKRDEISRPREERRPPIHHQREGPFRWEDEFGPTPSHWFQQWLNVIKHDCIIKTRELAKAGVVVTPLDFFSEMELQEIARRRRKIMVSALRVKESAERQDGQGDEQVEAQDTNRH